MAEPMGDAVDELLRKIDKLEETNGALCAEINRQERVIEQLREKEAAYMDANHEQGMQLIEQDKLITNRDESIHNLVKVLDKRQERIKALESLLVDVWPYVWELRIPGRRDEEFEARFKELGLEVES